MKKVIPLFLFVVFSFLAATAQDVYLANQYANPIYLNPAFSGGSAGPAVFINYRNQWPGISGSYVTYMTAIDIPVDKMRGGFGALFFNESSDKGLINNYYYGLSYAHSLRFSEKFSIKAGLEGAYISKSIDWQRMTMYIAEPTPLKDKLEMAEISVGLLASGKKFNAGFSVRHINEPNQSFYITGNSPLPRKYILHGTKTFTAGKFNFSPLLLLMKQGSFIQTQIGCYFNRGLFSVGTIYHSRDAIILSVGIRSKKVRLGYSYDITSSKLGMQTLGSHEVYLIGTLPSKKEREKLQPANLPVF